MSGDARFLKLSEAPEFLESTWSLIDKHFPRGEPTQKKDPLDQEFALLLNPKNYSRILICVVNNQVVSTSSWRPFEVMIPGRARSLSCAGIGLVVTDPDHRKKGYAAKLQTLIEHSAIKEGALISLLWSDLHDFYMKQGFLPAGTEYMWSVSREDLAVLETDAQNDDFILEPLSNIRDIHDLYSSQGQGPKRVWEDYAPLLELSDTYAWVAKNKQNSRVMGYALMGKARDLRNTVHEIVSKPECVPSLLFKMSSFLERKAEEMRIQIPADSALKTTLSDLFGPPELSALSYMKILDTKGICDWINSNQILPKDMILESKTEDRGFVLRNNSSVVWDSPDEGHILQLFFGPWKPAALSIPKSLKVQLEGTQSIGIYFWGFDSV